MKKILKLIMKLFIGKKIAQKLFEKIYYVTLRGMNIGTGENLKDNGENFVINYINKSVKGSIVVFDVGANIGEYSKTLNDILGPRASIYAFEPSKKTFFTLRQNIEKYKNIKLNNFGLGSRAEKLLLYSDSDNSGLSSIYNRRLGHYNIKMNQHEYIDIKTIDEFCEEMKIENINFLKLDVEGQELRVLEGANKMLFSSKIDFIQFEFGGCNIDSKTFFQDFWYLLSERYYIYRILLDGLYEIKSYAEFLENFFCTNYFAQRKDLKK